MGTPRRKSGVLAGEVEPYRAWLLAQGYSPEYVLTLLSDLSRLGVWLQEGGRPGTGIDPDDVRRLFAARRRAGVVRVPGGAIIGRLLAFLAGRGLVAQVASVEPTPLQALLISFRAWMVGGRGLSSPRRQSTSPNSSRATSIERSPSRATSNMIARSRAPATVAASQLSITRCTSARGS